MRNKSSLKLLLAFLLVVLTVSASNSNFHAKKLKVFEEFVLKQKQVDHIPGISIAFMKDGQLWAKGFGYANLEDRVPATPETAYRLASVTKPMTAVAVLQLYERGLIDLNAEVQKYVPYFPRKRWPVIVRHLLGHLAGISHYRERWELHIKEPKDTREALSIFARFELVAKPGTRFNYSSYGYNLLGAVIEGAAKMPYGKYMQEHIWKPLGMFNTRMDDPDEIIPHRARGYRLIDGELKNSEFINISSRFAAGGTRSTVIDLLKFIKGIAERKLLSEKTIDMMFTSMATENGVLTDYGMGWMVRPVNGRFCVFHSGAQAETRTLLMYFPADNFAIAIGCNLEGANPYLYAQRLFQIVFQEPWNLQPYMKDKISEAIYLGLHEVFNYGLSYFQRYGKPMTLDGDELTQAFSYFNRFVNPDYLRKSYSETLEKIKEGRHPVSKQVFVKIGSYMAYELRRNLSTRTIEIYHKKGALKFFKDYITLYKSKKAIPSSRTFSSSIEELISRWNSEWEATLTDFTASLFITATSDFDSIKKRLKKTFQGHTLYPNYVHQLARAARKLYLNDNISTAMKAARLAVEFYPESGISLATMGNVLIASGRKEEAKKFYGQAAKADVGKEGANPSALYRYAYEFFEMKKWKEALDLAEIALQIYPKEARFYSLIADIYLRKAKELYKKALELDPNYDPAWIKLKKMKKENL